MFKLESDEHLCHAIGIPINDVLHCFGPLGFVVEMPNVFAIQKSLFYDSLQLKSRFELMFRSVKLQICRH